MCRFEERTSPRGRKHRAGVLLPSASPRERATPALCFLPLEFGPFLEPTHREDIFPTYVSCILVRLYAISQTSTQLSATSPKVAPSYRNSRTGFTFWIAQSIPLQYRVKVFRSNRTIKSMRISVEITFINKKS